MFSCLANYRPRSEASEGYVFTGVCHSVTERGQGRWATPMVNHFPLQDQVRHLPPPRDQVRTSTPSPPGPGQNIYPPPPRTRSEHLPPPLPPGTMSEHLPPPPETTRRRAVRILLECILVWISFR